MTDAALDLRGPGDNLPDNLPLDADAITMRLAEEYNDLPARLAELLVSLDRAPEIITTDEENKQYSDLKKEFRALRKKAESNREKEKEFFLSGGRRVDGWFKKWMDPAAKALTKITERKTTYEREVEAAERRRRQEEERKAREEAERLAVEAEKALAEAAAREAAAREAAAKAAREAAAREAAAEAKRKELEAKLEAERRRVAEQEAAARDAVERAASAEAQRAAAEAALQARAREAAQREVAEREAAEAARIAAKAAAEREAADLKAAEAAQKAADQAAGDAVKASRAAGAKAADLSRSRSDHGSVSSLHTFMDHKPEDPNCIDPVDRAKVDLEPLRPFLPMDALDKAVKALVNAGGRELRGVTIFENTVSRG